MTLPTLIDDTKEENRQTELEDDGSQDIKTEDTNDQLKVRLEMQCEDEGSEQHTVRMPSTVLWSATPGGIISALAMLMSNEVVIANKACGLLEQQCKDIHKDTHPGHHHKPIVPSERSNHPTPDIYSSNHCDSRQSQKYS